uniref:Phosphodiesterase n=1 Tax=Chromera velia CCMP2878 TaxID=1169474 RepID=A0A0G4I780_9ALVE|eukprot:Cvel_11592.t1-p1 / transcript=Cvel_11592.t1 / gene=Cvel_11592 / organism=Chromera_velia_CCMP2878 / gene_product=Calcium/calmodulin-dependent 3',5'-cyclic, putative / transcript_product=Calcium/calmodulin-dependent 3',5'-cyclic, putative / location=Cvel_scaffold733:45759-51628(+) / protein_length=615 / sequence_SO=supercontig / SO=protein_coding / is_pseudo=false
MFFKARRQRRQIVDLLDEVDGLIKVKDRSRSAGFSSAERMVDLVTRAIDELRLQENALRVQSWRGDSVTPSRLANTTRQVIKDLSEAAALASHAENLMQVDIQQMVRFANINSSEGSERKLSSPALQREMSPFSSPVNAEDQQQQQLLSPMNREEEGRMVNFLNANFVQQRVQDRFLALASRRRSSVFFAGDKDNPPPPMRSVSTRERVEEQLRDLLDPLKDFLPGTLGRKPDEIKRSLLYHHAWVTWHHQLYLRENGTRTLGSCRKKKVQSASRLPPARCPTVALMTVWLAEHSGARRLLNPIQKVSVVIAALCHDLGHQGFNNQFHMNSGSEIAMMYNDRSVLENFHAAKTFLVLKTAGCEILHFESVSALKLLLSAPESASSMGPSSMTAKEAKGEKEKDGGKGLQQKAEDNVWMVTRACIKAADLGHSARPWRIHFARSLSVVSEFFLQGDRERIMGLPISPLCNRTDTTPSGLCKSQVGFLTFVCRINTLNSHVSLEDPPSPTQPQQPQIQSVPVRASGRSGSVAFSERVSMIAPVPHPRDGDGRRSDDPRATSFLSSAQAEMKPEAFEVSHSVSLDDRVEGIFDHLGADSPDGGKSMWADLLLPSFDAS